MINKVFVIMMTALVTGCVILVILALTAFRGQVEFVNNSQCFGILRHEGVDPTDAGAICFNE